LSALLGKLLAKRLDLRRGGVRSRQACREEQQNEY
jgi:hypothetical protein